MEPTDIDSDPLQAKNLRSKFEKLPVNSHLHLPVLRSSASPLFFLRLSFEFCFSYLGGIGDRLSLEVVVVLSGYPGLLWTVLLDFAVEA